ncbi:Lipid A export ATP-binding/permease protein MsbA [Leucobacter sp. 7(1)]|uniref:ABC transporter ATP-binding protein n=1 Tax=Leucobacter sp. 7(1) TaxID=1255613 RepID=UPI00097EF6C6|nr:ABC transporter ATP-binding protein [Leucobacter sp. 7(1)]SJN08917.1 Lipid A export ATP-binding/permease protein MsbA [Leucobacter sp. 7(1)]
MIRTLIALLPAGSRRRVTAHLTLTVVSVALRAAGVVMLVPLVAALFGAEPKTAWPWLAGLAIVTIAGWVVDTAAMRIGFDLGFGVLESGQDTVAEHLTDVRLTWFTSGHTATARQAVAASGPDLVGLIIYLVTPLIGAVLLPLAIGLALLPIAWQLGVTALVGVPILLLAFWASGRFSREADSVAADSNAELTERLIEFARTQHALRSARRVAPERSHVGEALAAQHGATVRLLLLQLPGQLVFGLASQLALILLAGTVVVLTMRGGLAVPEAIAVIVVIVRYLEPFTVLAELSPGVESTTGALRRIREVLEAPTVPAGSAALPRTAAQAAPEVELRGVSFGYGTATAVLADFDLTLAPGSTTAIVGPSGSGKSTVLALLAGVNEPSAGQILVDGQDVSELTREARRELVSVVFQHPFLFDGSVRENVLVGQPDAKPEALRTAGELSRVTAIAERLPDGWETRVGEAGGGLSGGERQRVSIARALLKPAPILLVDEATSALDTENEAAVTAALTGDAIPRTRVIVAHRLSSIREADRVVFVEDGAIVEDGGVAELLAAGGRFAEFWRQQDASAGWQIGGSSPPPGF